MLLREGDDRNISIDVRLAALLSSIAGGVSTVGFHAAGYFSANMTGNVSALSDHLASGNLRFACLFLAVVTAFVLGAFSSALLIERGRRKGVTAIYAYAIMLEAVLLAFLGCADMAVPSLHSGPALIVGLSYLMGLQNATTTRISNARVRTTHVSGMVTDIGIALAALWDNPSLSERHAANARLQLYGATVAAFLWGGVAGVMLYRNIGGGLLLVAAALLLSISVPEVRRAGSLRR